MTNLRHLPHKSVLNLAWPMILSNISVPLLGIVDTAILGHLPSPAYLSAVALGASLLSMIFWSFGFLRMGTTSLTAQAFGRQNNDQVEALLVRSLQLALSIGLLLTLFRQPILNLAIELMQPSDLTAQLASSYGQIRMLSAPLVLANVVILGWFIGQQNTRVPLILLVATNLANLLLDIVFIWGLGLNSDGAAMATVCADSFGFALGLFFIRRQLPNWRLNLKRHINLHWQSFKPLLVINQHLFVRTLCLLTSLIFFNAQGAQMGDVTLAGNAIIFQLLMICSYGLDGIAHASEALIGHSVGARQQQKTRQYIVTTGIWSVAIATAMTLVFAVSKHWLIPMFTDISSIQEMLHLYYTWIIALPLICVWGYWLDGIFIGAGETKTMQKTMLFSVLAIFFPVWFVTQDLDNHGLWLAFSLFSLSRGVGLALYLPSVLKIKIT
ncbi:MAG: MATE family efflux transporter [Cellvibrionaceae bacterium]